MKGSSSLFGSKNENGRWNSKANVISNKRKTNGVSYDLKNHITPHNIPVKHTPNSTIEQRDDNGKIVRIRYYDENGNAYKDVDYTDHDRPDTHKVPHTHIIVNNGIIDRKKGTKSYGNSTIY